MRVLMICTEKLPLPPIRGGAIQTYIDGVLPFLKEHHDITVLGINDPALPDEETINGIHYVRIPGKIFDVYREGVTHFLQTHSFDLIHIFNRPRLVLPVRQHAPGAKITLSMHNDMFFEEKISKEEAAQALDEVSHIATVSNYIGNVIRTLYPQASSKLHTVYSGVDSERFLPGHHSKMKAIRETLRREHGLENKTVILFAGRLSRNKGVDRLIRALPQLTKRFNNLALVIVGSNWFSQDKVTDYVAYVRALAKKLPIPVVNTGFVSPSEIQNWFAAADLFVCTSIWQEPLARVHYEAMAAGLPIITTNRGGNAEVIELNENGLIVEHPEDPSEFASKLTDLLASPSLMKSMGQKGRELAVSLYNWKRVGNDLLKVWELARETELVKSHEVTQTEEVPSSETVLDSPVFVETEEKVALPEPEEETAVLVQPSLAEKPISLIDDLIKELTVTMSLFNEPEEESASILSSKRTPKRPKTEMDSSEKQKRGTRKTRSSSAVKSYSLIPVKGRELNSAHKKEDYTTSYKNLVSVARKVNPPLDLFHDW